MAEEHQNADNPENDPMVESHDHGESAQSPRRPGNRPAQNAPVLPPSRQFEDMWASEGLEATDFLGLNAEIQQPLGYAEALQSAEEPAPIQPAHSRSSTGESWMLDPAEDDYGAGPDAVEAGGSYDADGNWLLDGDGADAPMRPLSGTTAFGQEVRPRGLARSYVDPETKPRGGSRLLVSLLAAVGVVAVFGVMWKVVTTTGPTVDPGATVEIDRTGLEPVELVDSGDLGSGGTRRGVHRDGTIDPPAPTPTGGPTVLVGATDPETTDPGATSTALVDPVTEDPTPAPVELPPSPEELEARAVLATLEELSTEPTPDTFRFVTWDDVVGVELADDYFDLVNGTDQPEFLPLSSQDGVADGATDPAVGGDGMRMPPDLSTPGLEAPMVTTEDVAMGLTPEPVSGRSALAAHLVSRDRSILDQFVSMVRNGGAGGTRLDYVARIGQESAFLPADPFMRATIGDSALYLPITGPDYRSYIAGDDNLLPPTDEEEGLGGGSISVDASDLEGFEGESDAPESSRRKRLADHWYEERVPREYVNRERRLLTPRVGAVRVLYAGDEVFEGRLFAVGEGRIWVDTVIGRMVLEGEHTERVDRVDLDPTKLAGGDPGMRNLAGLPRVRVRARGGTFVGRQIQRDGDRVTLVTDQGFRVTLDSTEIAMAPNQDVIVDIKKRRAQ